MCLIFYLCTPEFWERKVKTLRSFDIHIYNLSLGEHDYEFEVNENLFEAFENEIVKRGKLIANISLKKSETMIEMDFRISGQVELECDRSLDLFDYPLAFEKRIIFKLGDVEEELSDEILVISRDTQTINVASLIFEFIGVEIPMKKLHPRFADEDEDEEGRLIFSSAEEDKEEKTEPDPRWEALQKLKNKE